MQFNYNINKVNISEILSNTFSVLAAESGNVDIADVQIRTRDVDFLAQDVSQKILGQSTVSISGSTTHIFGQSSKTVMLSDGSIMSSGELTLATTKGIRANADEINVFPEQLLSMSSRESIMSVSEHGVDIKTSHMLEATTLEGLLLFSQGNVDMNTK